MSEDAGEFAVTIPEGAGPGAFFVITAPSGQTSLVTVPPDGASGQQIKCVQAKDAGLAQGAFTGGGVQGAFTAAEVVGKTLERINGAEKARMRKKPGEGVFIACATCYVNNETKMTMSNMARFTCGACGAEVRWRPRQIWLRDQGMQLEKPIHLKPDEKDSVCCVIA